MKHTTMCASVGTSPHTADCKNMQKKRPVRVIPQNNTFSDLTHGMETEMNRTGRALDNNGTRNKKKRFLLFTHFSRLLSRSWSQRQQDKLICHSSPQQLPRASEDLKLSLQAILESVVPAGGLGSISPSPHSQPWLEHLQGKVPRGAALCQCEEATAPHPSESESGRQDGAQ